MSLALVAGASLAVFFLAQVDAVKSVVAPYARIVAWGFLTATLAARTAAWLAEATSPLLDVGIGVLLGVAVAGGHSHADQLRARAAEQ